jgi:hypothetical protein
MKKNCSNCEHLEWVSADTDSNSGFDCNKRHEAMYDQGRESELLSNLDRDEYREKAKVCHDAKL